MIPRNLTGKILDLSTKYPVVILTGPRQSGKTTLIRAIFPDLPYVSLEDPDIRLTALNDPRGFLSNYGNRVIFDEVQRTPDLLSYIQTIVDQDRNALFVLSGSQNFLLLEKVTQSLAGRGAVLNLLPFSNAELFAAGFTFDQYEALIFQGHYPRLYDHQGQRRLPYFWRDNHGREIDCIIDHGASVVPIEIKSGKTVSDRYFKNLEWWQGIAQVPIEQNYVVYGGDQSLRLSAGRLLGWRDVGEIAG